MSLFLISLFKFSLWIELNPLILQHCHFLLSHPSFYLFYYQRYFIWYMFSARIFRALEVEIKTVYSSSSNFFTMALQPSFLHHLRPYNNLGKRRVVKVPQSQPLFVPQASFHHSLSFFVSLGTPF